MPELFLFVSHDTRPLVSLQLVVVGHPCSSARQKKKRARESDDPATEMINRRPKIEDAETERARKKRKKARRKSAAT